MVGARKGRGLRGLGWALPTLLVALAVLLVPASADAGRPVAPDIHAHRGGTLETIKGKQVPVRPEETVATFKHAAKLGFVLELDVKLTADNVPIVIHDYSLERTTNCDENVDELTAAQLRKNCEVDLLGTTDNDKPMKKNDDRRAPVPTLKQVLKLAKKQRAPINLEIKNIPTDADFDSAPMPEYAKTIAAVIKSSKFPAKKLIVQSFWPKNLDVIEADPYFNKAKTSYLSLNVTNTAIRDAAAGAGYDYISPEWPVTPEFVSDSHDMGLKVAPFTIDTATDLKDAAKAGVDALITNDPLLARKVLGG
jgi:glycerophosphoryl diester phosphodiesterase